MSNKPDDINRALEDAEYEEAYPRIDFKKPPRKLGDVLEEIAPQGEKVKVVDLVDHQITIHQMSFPIGEFGPYIHCVITDDNGQIMNVNIGQTVLYGKLRAVASELPVSLVITVKQNKKGVNYYDVE